MHPFLVFFFVFFFLRVAFVCIGPPERIAEKARHPLLKAWLKNQALLFTPVSCLLVALGWQYYLHPRHIARTRRVTTEGAALVARHLLFFGGLCAGLTWGQVGSNEFFPYHVRV